MQRRTATILLIAMAKTLKKISRSKTDDAEIVKIVETSLRDAEFDYHNFSTEFE